MSIASSLLIKIIKKKIKSTNKQNPKDPFRLTASVLVERQFMLKLAVAICVILPVF